jgi:nucleosome binding factor SPN SPT16 subunit
MVLIHFHLKDFIMIGKKKQKDVQFYTEVIDASLNLDGPRRSAYDPDELDEEQREREMRKKLNLMFKEFCLKLEKVASHYGHNLSIDVPFRKSGFEGNCHKEMVYIIPTTHCLTNLTEVPPFVLTLKEVEHCHFERITYATKNFDLTFIFKNFGLPPKVITAIDMKYLDTIQDWLNLVGITYTQGGKSMNWNDTMVAVRETGKYFYLDVDADGNKKPPGWLFLSGAKCMIAMVGYDCCNLTICIAR